MPTRKTSFALRGSAVVALGIVFPAMLFAVVEALILRDLPCPQADRVALLFSENQRLPGTRLGISGRNLVDLREQLISIEALAPLAIVDGGEVHFREGVEVFTQGFFSKEVMPLLGLSPIRGRWFSVDEPRASVPQEVVVSERFWRDRLGSNWDHRVLRVRWGPSIVPVSVVGVLSSSPILPMVFGRQPDLIYPASILPEWDRRRLPFYQALVRLRPTTRLSAAQAELASRVSQLRAAYPRENAEFEAKALPLRKAILGRAETLIWLLFIGAGMIWMIAAANFGAILISRLDDRQVDLAIRSSLGASAGQLAREIGKDVATVVVAGTSGGVIAAHVGMRIAAKYAEWTGIPGLAEARMDPSALLFAASAAIVAAVVAMLSVLPRIARISPARLMSGRKAQGAMGSTQFSGAMVAAQFCLTLVLVNMAVVAGKSLVESETRVLGYNPREILAMQLRYPFDREPNREQRWHETFQSIVEFAGHLDHVQAATAAYPRPTSREFLNEFSVEGASSGTAPVLALERRVAPNYFKVMEIPLVRGRSFSREENYASNTIVVNDAFARKYSPDRPLVGHRLALTREGPSALARTIVGVVGNSLENPLDDNAQPTVYFPGYWNWVDLLVRTDRPDSIRLVLQKYIHGVDPRIPIDNVETLEAAVQAPLGRSKSQTLLSTVFAAASLLLATTGLYALVRQSCANKQREYAIRLALGATPGQLVRMRFKQTVWTAGGGLAAGMVLSFAFGRVLRGMLYHVSDVSPTALGLTGVGLLLIALFASYLSIRGAAQLQPSDLMRSD